MQAPVVSSLLPKLHCNRNMSRSVIYGPAKLGGFVIMPIYALHACEASKILSKHLRKDTAIEKLLYASIDYLYLESGHVERICTYPPPTYLLNTTWVLALWQAINKCI